MNYHINIKYSEKGLKKSYTNKIKEENTKKAIIKFLEKIPDSYEIDRITVYNSIENYE